MWTVLSSLNVSAQFALPEWVRGRGLAMYMTALFGITTLGSAIWGEVASVAGLPAAHFVAAAGALLAIPLTWWWKLQTAQGMDLTPSMSWPAPIVTGHVGNDQAGMVPTPGESSKTSPTAADSSRRSLSSRGSNIYASTNG
jgi:hypothetical protein